MGMYSQQKNAYYFLFIQTNFKKKILSASLFILSMFILDLHHLLRQTFNVILKIYYVLIMVKNRQSMMKLNVKVFS